MTWLLTIPVCFAVGVGFQYAPPADARLSNLSQQRQNFEKLVVHNPRYDMEEHIYTMPLDQHVEGYYPVGISNRRYLINQNGGPKQLVFQSIRGGRGITLWGLALKASHGRARFHGTLGKMLHAFGAEVKGKVTASERASLNAHAPFAAYDMGGVDGQLFSAWVVKSDGTRMTYHSYDNGTSYQGRTWVPITDDEAEAMGLGKASWPPNAKPRLRVGPP